MKLRDQTLADIEAFLVRHGMSARAFGVAFRGDTAFVYRLREGKGIASDTIDDVRVFMRDYRPAGNARRRKAESRPAA